MIVNLTDKEVVFIRHLLEAELWRMEDEEQDGLVLETQQTLAKFEVDL